MTAMPTPLESALAWATQDIAVLPIWWPRFDNGVAVCACPDKYKRDGKCKPAKHPIADLVPKSHLDATLDPAVITTWWTHHPNANIGIALPQSGLVDVAPDSIAWLEEFRARGLPETICWQSSAEGHVHFLYRRPDGCPIARITRRGQYDVLTDGYAVAPYSLHSSGERYRLLSPPGTRVADAEAWKVEMLQEHVAQRQARAQHVSAPPDEPPVRLDAESLAHWRGERLIPGDRSQSLVNLAQVLRDAGATRRTIIEALEERDATLGWHTYTDRGDADVRYAEIFDKYTHVKAKVSGATASSANVEVEWPDPAVLDEIPAAPSLPLNCLPAPLAVVAKDAATRMQAAVDYVAFPMLVTASTAIGRNVGLRLKQKDNWIERASGIWVADIGDPSSMKTPMHHEGIHPLRRLEKIANDDFATKLKEFRDQVAEAKANKTPLPEGTTEPVHKLWLTDDYTSEALADMLQPDVSRGLALTRDELSGVIDSLNKYRQGQGDDRQVLIESYNGLPKTINRKVSGYTFVPCLVLNVVGGIQESLARLVFGGAAEKTDDGLATRFISIWPDDGGEWQHVDQIPRLNDRDNWNDLVEVLATTNWSDPDLALIPNNDLTGRPLPYAYFSNEAQSVFDDWYTRTMRSHRGPKRIYRGRLAGRVGKYPGLFGRLTLTVHLIDWAAKPERTRKSPREVSADLVRRTVRLFDEYLLPMDQRVYAAFNASRDAELGQHIAVWIRSHKPQKMTAREARRAVRGKSDDAVEIARAVEWLASQNWLREAETAPFKRGRPGSEVFLVNPRVWEG